MRPPILYGVFMAINLKDTVQIIRGAKADIASRTGANGELNWADDTYELYIHDGKTRGGHLIGKASGTASIVGGVGIAVSTSDGISTVSVKRDPANILYATTDGAGVRIGTSGALQITAQNALDLRVVEGGGIIVDSNGVKIDSAVLSSVFRYAGQVNSVDDLPSGAQSGDVYDVKDSGANYVWSGTSWDNLGGIMSVDTAPTQGSTNPVASGGVYDAIQDVKLFGDGTTVTVTNNIISVPQYEGATADTAATSGLVPPAAAGEQDKVLRGDGEWGEYLPLAGGTMIGAINNCLAFGRGTTLTGSTIEVGSYNVFYKDITADTTFTMGAFPSGYTGTVFFTLLLNMPDNHTITWPLSWNWGGDGTPPELGSFAIINVMTTNYGVSYHPTLALNRD